MFSTESHPSFQHQPKDTDIVWRYIDLARLISLLQSSSLFFTRVDLLEDQWEGHLDAFSFKNVAGSSDSQGAQDRIYNFVNCWNVSAYESVAMWHQYQREGRGVAVKSTWGDLKASIISPYEIQGGLIEYIDYDTTRIPFQDNQYNRFMYKRLSFEHEHEVRLVHWAHSTDGVGWVLGEYGNQGRWTTAESAPTGAGWARAASAGTGSITAVSGVHQAGHRLLVLVGCARGTVPSPPGKAKSRPHPEPGLKGG